MHEGELSSPVPSLSSSPHITEPVPVNPEVHSYEHEAPKATGSLLLQVTSALFTASVGTAQVIAGKKCNYQ